MPAYKRAAERTKYWQDFGRLAARVAEERRAIVFIGDLNADPGRMRTTGGRTLAALRVEGWQVPDPSGPWSFRSLKHAAAERTSRIDHVIAWPQRRVSVARYVTATDGYVLAGCVGAISDHAALCVDLASDALPKAGEPA